MQSASPDQRHHGYGTEYTGRHVTKETDDTRISTGKYYNVMKGCANRIKTTTLFVILQTIHFTDNQLIDIIQPLKITTFTIPVCETGIFHYNFVAETAGVPQVNLPRQPYINTTSTSDRPRRQAASPRGHSRPTVPRHRQDLESYSSKP